MGMGVKVDTSELKELSIELKGGYKPIERELKNEIKRSSIMIYNNYKRNARAHYDTGELDRSISVDRIAGGYSIGSTAKQSIYLELGTKPHMIPLAPKKDGDKPRFLVFYWPQIGQTVYAEQVSHPGIKAKNLIFRAYIPVMEPFDRTFAARLKKALENLLELQ